MYDYDYDYYKKSRRTLSGNAVAEGVEPVAGGEVVDMGGTADGVAVDDEIASVRRRKDFGASTGLQVAHVERP